MDHIAFFQNLLQLYKFKVQASARGMLSF